jgi:hypothetical protein
MLDGLRKAGWRADADGLETAVSPEGHSDRRKLIAAVHADVVGWPLSA